MKVKGEFDPNERDELFEDAARIIVQTQQGSTSLLQRNLNWDITGQAVLLTSWRLPELLVRLKEVKPGK